MRKALAIAAFGARGTGKTAWVRQWVADERRLLVWDFKHDDGLNGLGVPHADLAGFVRAAQAPAFQLRYLVNHDRDVAAQFDLFCMAAWEAGNLTMFVDELPEVTKANRAPPMWRKCVNVGRLYDGGRKSLTIIGAGQRPAECDKSFIGNCDIVHTGRLGNMAEAKAWAAAWGCPASELATMPDLHYIEKRADRPELVRGVLSFGNEKRTPTKKNHQPPVPAKRPLRKTA